MGTVYLIRHGFTPANNANYNNQKDLWKIADDKNMPLEKEYGVVQAQELGDFLDNITGKSLILVSPYRRARETLEIAIDRVSFDYEIEICDDLRENNSGVFYAKTKDEILSLYEEAEDYYREFELDSFNTPYIGGESQYDVRKRTKDISFRIKELSENSLYDNILVFAQGTVNYWVFYWLNKKYMNKQRNCEVIVGLGNNSGSSIFLPNAWVPKGYMVDIDSYLD